MTQIDTLLNGKIFTVNFFTTNDQNLSNLRLSANFVWPFKG